MTNFIPQSLRAAQLVEQAILRGELPPGKPLRIQELSDKLGIGATPLREGLTRLVSQGHVQLVSNSGFRVKDVSEADLADILRVRTLIETEALAASIQRGDAKWEARIVAALHEMRSFEQRGLADQEGNHQFDELHKAFHTALLSACDSERLLDLHRALYDQAFRYRMVMLQNVNSHSDVADVHVELANLVLARDTVAATELLRSHIQLTARLYTVPARPASRQ
jgi:GntR family carbon starvation induced transcriptional regulator